MNFCLRRCALLLPREMIINKILEQKGPLLTKVSHAREKRKATQV